MDTIDYFSQPEPGLTRCTIHILTAPRNFSISDRLMRLTECSRDLLKSVFHNAPRSFNIPNWRRKEVWRYLNSCRVCYTTSFIESPTGSTYNRAADRLCIGFGEIPLWSELAFNG